MPHSSTPRIKFARPQDDFHDWLKARVERYFAYTGRRERGAISLYTKALILLAFFAASYIALVFFAVTWWLAILLAICLGVAIAGIGFCIQHDGGHRAFSRYNWLNRLAAMSLDMLGGSSYTWDHKHNTIHHTYANIAGHDDDIDLGFLGRLAPTQRRIWFHRVQHFYLWVLYALMPIKWQMFDDYRDVVRGRIGPHRFARPRGRKLVAFIGGKALFLSLAFVIPLLFNPFWMVVLFYAVVCCVNGLLISTVFQLAHAVEEAEFPVPAVEPAVSGQQSAVSHQASAMSDRPNKDVSVGHMPSDWAAHQVQTTVNFAPRNPVLTWFLGGLNHQIEHHLFPRISHVHYPRIARLVQSACRRFDLPYHEHKTVFVAIASHYRWLREMGKPVPVPVTVRH